MIKINNKKATGLPISTVIIAAICLMVLIIVLAIFYSQTGGVATSLGKISKDAGQKAEEAQGNLDEFFTCKEDSAKCISTNSISTCKDGKWSEPSPCSDGLICKGGECIEKKDAKEG